MAHRRKQTGMNSGRKDNLSTRLYNPDGSRNTKGEKDRSLDKQKSPNSFGANINKFLKGQKVD